MNLSAYYTEGRKDQSIQMLRVIGVQDQSVP